MKKKINLQDLIDLASENNGKCLSPKFETVKSKYIWACSYGHIWSASFNNIAYNKTWCPLCSRKKRPSLEDMQNLAAKRGGRCLSNKYINRSTKLQWQCNKGHIWKATANNIEHRNSWCRECNRIKNASDQLKKLKRICEMNKINLKSRIYVNNNTLMDFQCLNGHIWASTPRQLKKGYLCPICSGTS